ncbi:MAG: DUF92 domain-containing protein [Anaerolineae bacterium]|nr:DUF92 domain-containing protein [Anaerolineae bacterium]
MIERLVAGLALSALIGGVGYWRRALSAGGVIGAVLVGTAIFGLGGWVWGLLLITFFVSSSWLSHYRQGIKERIADKFAKGSRRDLGQALANGGLGALLAAAFALDPEPLFFAAFLGVMGAVNADTWATELGVLSRVPPRLITTGQEVAAGTSGGVTRLGVWASVAGALLIGAVATALTQAASLLKGGGWQVAAIAYPLLAVTGGLAGSLFDSLLGATAQGVYFCDYCEKQTERRVHRCGQQTRLARGWEWLNNDVVNLVASAVGGLTAALLAWIVWR